MHQYSPLQAKGKHNNTVTPQEHKFHWTIEAVYNYVQHAVYSKPVCHVEKQGKH